MIASGVVVATGSVAGSISIADSTSMGVGGVGNDGVLVITDEFMVVAICAGEVVTVRFSVGNSGAVLPVQTFTGSCRDAGPAGSA